MNILYRPHNIFLPLPSSYAPVSQFSYKPWLNEQDADEVFFGSINLYNESDPSRFYPCTGKDCSTHSTDSPESVNIVNIALSPVGPGPWDIKAKAKLTKEIKKDFISLASTEYR